MVSFSDFKYFYRIFFILGQAPYYPRHERNQLQTKILMRLPVILLAILSLLCTATFFQKEPHKILKDKSLILYVLTFIEFVPNFVVIIENFARHSLACNSLNNKIYYVYNFMEIKMKMKFQKTKFNTECVWDFCKCISMISFTHIMRMFLLFVFDLKTEIIIYIMQFYKTWAILHIMFYVNLLRFTLVSINDGIQKMDYGAIVPSQIILNVDCKRSHQLKTVLLSRIRFTYLKLWEANRMFNFEFGWTIIAIILEAVISATNAFFGTFLYFDDWEKFTYYTIRKCFFTHFFN